MPLLPVIREWAPFSPFSMNATFARGWFVSASTFTSLSLKFTGALRTVMAAPSPSLPPSRYMPSALTEICRPAPFIT